MPRCSCPRPFVCGAPRPHRGSRSCPSPIDLGRQALTEPPVERKAFDLSYAITLAAVFFTGLASAGLLVLKPLIVGALIDDYHFSPSQSGFVAGIEMAGIGVSALIVAAIGASWNRRLIILAGATLGILGSVVPVLSAADILIILSRLMAGVGRG